MSDFSESFTIHSTLVPTSASTLESYMQQGCLGNYRDGMNARVYTFNPEGRPDEVFKVTCCEPSSELFLRAHEARVRGLRLDGIPNVFGCHGPCATDSDGFAFRGFTVERLREGDTEEEIDALRGLLTVVRIVRERFEERNPGSRSWQVSLRVTRWLALHNVAGLRDAFGVVARVIRSTGAALDLEQPGNVMFTQDGRLCLADPVAMTFSAPA